MNSESGEQKHPLVSVLIPIYNEERYLRQALESLQAQIMQDLEFICINDGSTDTSLNIIREFIAQDGRFKLLDKRNSGYGASMNQGIAMAQGDYIAILEPDDYIDGQMYSTLYNLAEQLDHPDVVKSAYWSINNTGDTEQRFHCGFWKRIKTKAPVITLKEAPLLTRFHPSIWSGLYKRSFLANEHITFKEVPGAGWVDNPFMIETLLKASSIAYTDEAYYCYRDAHPTSSTANIADMHMPVDRWLEMTEIMESNPNALSDELWSIHTYKAFHYLSFAKTAANYDETTWITLAKQMFEKLPPNIVAKSSYISNKQKQFYCRTLNKNLPFGSNLGYALMLLQEAYWKVRQNGIGFMIKRALK